MLYNIQTVNGFKTEDGLTFAEYDAAAAHARELLHTNIGEYLREALADDMNMTVQEAFGQIVDAVLDGITLNWNQPVVSEPEEPVADNPSYPGDGGNG